MKGYFKWPGLISSVCRNVDGRQKRHLCRWGEKYRIYFCAHLFVQKRQMFTISQAHSHASRNETRCHEYSQGLHISMPGVLVSFLELHFLGKMALLALGGRPQPLKKPSQSQKGHFYEKMNALNDTKTLAMSKSAEGNGEYLWSSVAFVKAWIKSTSPNGTTGLKNHANFAQKQSLS